MYKELMDFTKIQKGQTYTPPSYSSASPKKAIKILKSLTKMKRVILLLEQIDLKWKDDS